MRDKRTLLRILVLAVIFVALGFTFLTHYLSDHSPVKVGEPAPDFILKNLEGEEVRLSDYRGKGVFINFWASWCPPCKQEMPDMEKNYRLFKEQGIEILAINLEESQLAISSFASRYDLSFTILLDTDKSVTNRYGVGPIPSSFFVDKDGIVVSKVDRILSDSEIYKLMLSIKP